MSKIVFWICIFAFLLYWKQIYATSSDIYQMELISKIIKNIRSYYIILLEIRALDMSENE